MILKKPILIVTLALFLSCNKEKPKIVWLVYRGNVEMLHGNVKQIEITDNGSLSNGDSQIINLDPLGGVVEERTYFHGNYFQTNYTTRYNSTGKKIESLGHFRNLTKYLNGIKPNDTVGRITDIYKYDPDDHIVKYFPNAYEPRGEYFLYKYDANGDMIECDHYFNSKDGPEITKYKYDTQHNAIGEEEFSENGKLKSRDFFHSKSTLDSQNNWVKLVNGTDTVTRKITYY